MTRVLVEFAGPDALAGAIRALRAHGYRGLDAHTPYSTHVVREALELPPSPLPPIVLGAALLGAGAAYGLEWLTNAHWYPLDVGGRPPHLPLAFVPISFEMGVLAAAFAAFIGVIAAGRLFKLWDPLFEIDGFESATLDAFWLSVDAGVPGFDAERLRAELATHEPRRFVLLGGWQ